MTGPYVPPRQPLAKLLMPEEFFVPTVGRPTNGDKAAIKEHLIDNEGRWFYLIGNRQNEVLTALQRWLPPPDFRVDGTGTAYYVAVAYRPEMSRPAHAPMAQVPAPSPLVGEHPDLNTINAMTAMQSIVVHDDPVIPEALPDPMDFEAFKARREQERMERMLADLPGAKAKAGKEKGIHGPVHIECDTCGECFDVAQVMRLHNHTMERHKRPPTKDERTPRGRKVEDG